MKTIPIDNVNILSDYNQNETIILTRNGQAISLVIRFVVGRVAPSGEGHAPYYEQYLGVNKDELES